MTSIGDLPMEVLEDIVLRAMSDRPPRSASLLASVHPTWQRIVEGRVFNTLALRERDSIPTVMEILRRRPWRFDAVRVMIVPVLLPLYPAIECKSIETPETRFGNDLAFSQGLNTLLRHLAEWPATRKGLELQLYAYSPTDLGFSYGLYGQFHRLEHGLVEGDIGHMRMFESTLEWHGSDVTVPNVTRFRMCSGCQRYISPTTMERLHRAFTRLTTVDMRFWDIYKIVPTARVYLLPDVKRRLDRRALAKALGQLPSDLDEMNLYIEYCPPANQVFTAQSTLDEHGNPDELTTAWRRATQKMSIVRTFGMLWTPELFWPKQISDADPEPSWPRLKHLTVQYHIVDPAGDWIFEADHYPPYRAQLVRPRYRVPQSYGPPLEDAQPSQFRFTAMQEKMDEFYSTLAKAATNMPKLEVLYVQAITYWGYDVVPFHMFCLLIDDYNRTARVVWSGNPRYEPSDQVLRQWRTMAYIRDLSLRFEWQPYPPRSPN